MSTPNACTGMTTTTLEHEAVPHNSRCQLKDESTSLIPSIATTKVLTDNPCWGSPTQCSLRDLLAKISMGSSILYDSPHYLALNKPPDLRMDGPYPATVHKLLTYWYPSDSLLAQIASLRTDGVPSQTPHVDDDVEAEQQSRRSALLDAISRIHWHNELPDNFLRPCHQLDYATSGVLLVAKSQHAAAHVSRLLEDRHNGVSKSYLAVVVGNVEDVLHSNDIPIWTNGLPIGANNSTMEDAERGLKEHLQRLEDEYRKKRTNVGKQKRRDGALVSDSVNGGTPTKLIKADANATFPGFQPAHSMFNKWKAEFAAQATVEKPPPDGGDFTSGAPPVRKRRRKRPSPLSDEDWNRIWKPVRETVAPRGVENDARGETIVDPRDTDWQALEWKQLGSPYPALKSALEEATYLHNNLLRKAMLEQQPEGVGSKSDGIEPSLVGLPTIFRLPLQTCGNNNESKTFYIFCPLAQHPDDFPMVIPSKVARQQGYPPNLPTASNVPGSTPSSCVLSSSLSPELSTPNLDFKPSLTKCTILGRAEFQIVLDGEFGDSGKRMNIPVTKVRLSPITGRRHQLRVHMLLAGHPILGDMTYGHREATNESATMTMSTTAEGHRPDSCSRMCLHAQSLALPSLVGETGEWKVVTPDPFVIADDGFLQVNYG